MSDLQVTSRRSRAPLILAVAAIACVAALTWLTVWIVNLPPRVHEPPRPVAEHPLKTYGLVGRFGFDCRNPWYPIQNQKITTWTPQSATEAVVYIEGAAARITDVQLNDNRMWMTIHANGGQQRVFMERTGGTLYRVMELTIGAKSYVVDGRIVAAGAPSWVAPVIEPGKPTWRAGACD